MGGKRGGLLITFEGGEGSGKSVQAERLAARLRAAGHTVTLTREPGGTSLGESIRDILLHPREGAEPSPVAELLLFEAARAQLVHDVIRPALDRGEVVICDRFADSSVAYQGHGRGLFTGLIDALNIVATGGITPDLTLLLDLPVKAGLARRAAAGGRNAFDENEIRFHQAVRKGYQRMAVAEPARWRVINAKLPVDEVHRQVWEAVEPLLAKARA